MSVGTFGGLTFDQLAGLGYDPAALRLIDQLARQRRAATFAAEDDPVVEHTPQGPLRKSDLVAGRAFTAGWEAGRRAAAPGPARPPAAFAPDAGPSREDAARRADDLSAPTIRKLIALTPTGRAVLAAQDAAASATSAAGGRDLDPEIARLMAATDTGRGVLQKMGYSGPEVDELQRRPS
jgi:hypothetical protein